MGKLEHDVIQLNILSDLILFAAAIWFIWYVWQVGKNINK